MNGNKIYEFDNKIIEFFFVWVWNQSFIAFFRLFEIVKCLCLIKMNDIRLSTTETILGFCSGYLTFMRLLRVLSDLWRALFFLSNWRSFDLSMK